MKKAPLCKGGCHSFFRMTEGLFVCKLSRIYPSILRVVEAPTPTAKFGVLHSFMGSKVLTIPHHTSQTATKRGEKDLRDFLDMVSLRILAKGSDTAPFGAVSALLAKDAEKLPYKIHKDFSTSVNKWEPLFVSGEPPFVAKFG